MSLGCITAFGQIYHSTHSEDIKALGRAETQVSPNITMPIEPNCLAFIEIRVMNTSGFLQQFCRTGSTDPTSFSSETLLHHVFI